MSCFAANSKKLWSTYQLTQTHSMKASDLAQQLENLHVPTQKRKPNVVNKCGANNFDRNLTFEFKRVKWSFYLALLPQQLTVRLSDPQPVYTHPQAIEKAHRQQACQNLVLKIMFFIFFLLSSENKKKERFSDFHTSWMWSFESSVKARMSFLRIPSSKMKRRAPSLMVSVRSSFLLTCKSLDPCLHNIAKKI